MTRLIAFALVVLSCIPAAAQPPPPQRQSAQLELLELEQDADKAILREALLLQGRMEMKPAPDTEREKQRFAEESVTLRDFIARKRASIKARVDELARADELANKRTAPRRGPQRPIGALADPAAKADREAALEKYEKANIEVQLLQAQVDLLQQPLGEAVQALAKAEVDASNDESLRPKADEARKAYEKLKARVVEHSKRLRLEQQEMLPMQQMLGGMRGMGYAGGMM
jgi:hypothetical protein